LKPSFIFSTFCRLTEPTKIMLHIVHCMRCIQSFLRYEQDISFRNTDLACSECLTKVVAVCITYFNIQLLQNYKQYSFKFRGRLHGNQWTQCF
jgi:hypothetical protein